MTQFHLIKHILINVEPANVMFCDLGGKAWITSLILMKVSLVTSLVPDHDMDKIGSLVSSRDLKLQEILQ